MSEEERRDLPRGWALTTLENVLWPLDDGRLLHQGWSPQCEKRPAAEEEWGVLKTTSIQPGEFLPEHNKKLPDHLAPRPGIEVKDGDVLLTCAGPRSRCGVACLVRHSRRRLMISGKMYRFRVLPDLFEPRFLEAYLQTSAASFRIDRMKTGGSDSGLNLTVDRFLLLPVAVAPLGEQRRIVEHLEELFSDLDAGVTALEATRAKLARLRSAVLKAAVEGSLTAEWRQQNPASESGAELLARILAERRARWEKAELLRLERLGKEPRGNWKIRYDEPRRVSAEALPELPKSWCWSSLDEICAITGGITKGQRRVDCQRGKEVPYLRVANVQRGYLDLESVKRIHATQTEIEALKLEPGDVLFNEGGDRDKLGRGWVWEGQIDECIHQNHVFRARPLLNEMNSKLISWCGNSYGQQWFMKNGKQSVNLASISLTVLKAFPVPVPPPKEQLAIVEAVEAQLSVIDHLEDDLDAKLKGAEALRQSILRDAFAGKLVPQDPQDEPASVLLERIATERVEREKAAKLARTATGKRSRRSGSRNLPVRVD